VRPLRATLPFLVSLALLLSIAAVPVSAAGQQAGVFRLTLTGDQEAYGSNPVTCAPPTVCGDPDALAQMILIVIPARDTVCFLTRWTGIDDVVIAAHIHVGPAGVQGPVVVPLFGGPFPSDHQLRGCVSANGLADDIMANPPAYYVNIHSNLKPVGAVRAQLS
jgi:CHRD domain